MLRSRLKARVDRLGYLGEFFQVAAHQPEALAGFIAFTEALKEHLDWRLAEVIALTVATETGNAYERVQHERLALTLGMTESEVRGLVSPATAGWPVQRHGADGAWSGAGGRCRAGPRLRAGI